MSCGPQATTFRVLDANSYWNVALVAKSNVTVGDRIELERLAGFGDGDILPYIPPRWLARGCGACTWWLACPHPARLLRSVGEQWVPAECCERDAVCPSAVAAASHRVAVLDRGRGDVRVYARDGHRVLLVIPTVAEGPIALDRDGTLYLVDGEHVRRFDRNGDELASWSAPAGIDRIAVTDDHVVWLVVTASSGWQLFRRHDHQFVEATLDELHAAFTASDLVAATDDGFCLDLPSGGADPIRACFDRCGCPLDDGAIPPPAPARYQQLGELEFALIDSGIPRCVWHRVRVEADLPPRTAVEVQVATVDDPAASLDAADWQPLDSSADFLIDQPPGRYLHVRLVLHGDGLATPSVRRIRLDFPRSTSAEWLPAVYREDPAGREFVDRFVSLFDASIEDIDRVIARFPALLDPAHVPTELIGWLASLVGVALDPGISPARRRDLIAAAPALFQMRGTPEGLRSVIKTAFGVDAAIEELGATTPFQRLGAAHLGGTRLFGRGQVRATLGSSKLGATRIHAFGDPEQDVRGLLAYRVRIQVPAIGELATPLARQRVTRLVDANKPAHVVATIRVGGGAALLGPELAIGIDTVLTGLAGGYLGTTARLSRQTILAPGTTRAGATISIGRDAVVGANTTLR